MMSIKHYLKRLRIFMLSKFKFTGWTFGHGFYCGFKGINDVKEAYIGNNVYIGNKFHLAVDYLEIGDGTLIASNVSIVGGDHKFDEVGTYIRDTHVDFRPGVTIGRDCWIGHGSIILSGVTIGEGAVIGAGSIVTKNIPAYSIAVGNPAKVIKQRFTKQEQEMHIKKIDLIDK